MLAVNGAKLHSIIPHAAYGQLHIVRLLVAHGAKAGTRDRINSSTPLHDAAATGQLNVIQFFVENSFDVNVRALFEKTPLHNASESGHLSVVEYLVKHGAELNTRNCLQKTPLHHAALWGSYKAVRFLVEHGADVNALDSNLRTPLHHTAQEGEEDQENYCDVFRFLANKRTDVDVEDAEQNTPLSLATVRCGAEIVKFLVERYVYIREVDARRLATFYPQESPQWLIDRRQKLSEALDQKFYPELRNLLMEFVLEKENHPSNTSES